jgi:hypothetical protein
VGGLTGQEAAATPESYESVEIKQKRLGKKHLLVPFFFLLEHLNFNVFVVAFWCFQSFV